MNNRMASVFALNAAVCAFLAVIMSTPLVAIDAGGTMLSTPGHTLGLHTYMSSTLAVLGILFLILSS